MLHSVLRNKTLPSHGLVYEALFLKRSLKLMLFIFSCSRAGLTINSLFISDHQLRS